MSYIKQIRKQAKVSQSAAAALAHVSPVSWRLFEANPDSVTEPIREACERAIEQMRRAALERSAA
jgi:DNA-binding XRE family transcriptional regulator